MHVSIDPQNMDLWRMLLKDWTKCQEGLEKQILKLEVQCNDQELIDDLYRRIHHMKRGASYAGLTVITMITHEIEVALHTIREREIEVHSDLIDYLLSAVEVLNDCIQQFSDKLKDHGSLNEGNELLIEFDVEKNWNEIVQKLHDIFVDKERKEPIEPAHETGGMEILQSEFPDKTKEQFLFEVYEHIDRMMNDYFIRLDQEENDRDAFNALLLAVHSIKKSIDDFRSILSTESLNMTVLHELSNVVHQFESLLALIRDRKQAFKKDFLNLGYEIADYLKATMESVALENGASILHADILDKIDNEILYLTSVQETENESEMQFKVSNKDHVPEPMQKASLPQSIRVSQDKLDKMMNMISELLIAKNAFMHLSAKLNVEYDLPELSKEVKEVGFSVNRISDELQNAIMSIRMVEVKTVFQKMPRIIRDVAQLTGKKMELVMIGENTEIDKTIVEQISDPIVHLIRNAADHGIEPADERLRKGKSETGKITLRAYNKDKHVYIEIEDDGKGIDASVLKQKALERGFITSENAEKMTKNQLINLIFLPGFSTAGQITEVSGRGVGMDIVKSNIEKINGSISIDSEIDKGTKMVIHLPLTIAISRGLVVDVSHETYIFPIDHISETVKMNARDIHEFDGKYFASHKREVIGIEWLSKLFLLGDRDYKNDEELNTVIISNGAEKFGLIVDKLKNEQEFVIKPLNGHLAGIPGISGSTLLGNGQVVLIINPIDLIQLAKS
ncbi:chemotaxis protein CheA [Gordoniibacillus kamchatkensis]|uniref:chemotaxis protein CheA n=1 Tax=Gordoniibacillus kamchatkensis TaxID=1590651 RepID=UPI0006989267|nr:chemotaxis protein CheA [Paenibacillus sp. VKM B-2647]